MRFLLFALVPLAAFSPESIQNLLEQAFYPGLLGILVIASLGLPIPEDIPLIAAGVILKTSPGAASWHGTLIVAMIGIMSGDLVLYSLGRRWGRDVFKHRSMAWLMSPERFEKAIEGFHRRGAWYVFFGRFFMGIRAVMCIAAGVTHFPYWRFFIADFCGALLSVPFFVVLGYLFADMIPTLMEYVEKAESGMLIGVAAIILAIIVWRVVVRRRKRRAQNAAAASAVPDTEPRPALRPPAVTREKVPPGASPQT